MDRESRILQSWHRNATPWVQAVREQQIVSRQQVTDAAIVAAIDHYAPRTLLDIGCGEGWLARCLAARGMAVTGLDAVPALIEAARREGGASYHLLSYQQLAEGALTGSFDALVCNFSLFGDDSVARLLHALPAHLNAGGHLFVQTLHPAQVCGDQPGEDGWREGSWQGFSDAFSDPAPWYFRTLESWRQLFAVCGWQMTRQLEPAWPDGRPASVIFVLHR
jgi:2-polyprenyl-3-methyl-5-hydroxy-6-metoxy-1,4-benzoquinol methylase